MTNVVLFRMRHPDHGEWICRVHKRYIRLSFNGEVLAREHVRHLDHVLSMWPRVLARFGFVQIEPKELPCT